MDNYLAPMLAIMYMNDIQNKIINELGSISFWLRYIDDIYVFFNNNCTCNAQNPTIQFTFELANEVDGLTLFIPTFTSKLNIKPLFSNTVLHATSHVPSLLKQKSAGQLKSSKIRKIAKETNLSDKIRLIFYSDKPIWRKLKAKRPISD